MRWQEPKSLTERVKKRKPKQSDDRNELLRVVGFTDPQDGWITSIYLKRTKRFLQSNEVSIAATLSETTPGSPKPQTLWAWR
jgi:hypothetical protein